MVWMSVSVKELIEKSRSSLHNDGMRGFLRKAKNWTVFQFKKDKHKEVVKDVLFINGCGLPHPQRYRVLHQMEQLEANGISSDVVFYTLVKPEMIKFYRCVVVFRCPITKEVDALIEKAHYYNKVVFFDIDDLVVDKKYTDKIKHVQGLDREEREEYDDGVERMGRTMMKSDYVITTTGALKRELEKYGKEVYVNRNVASEEMVRLSLDASLSTKKDKDEVVIGYLSGSITHNPDFELVQPVLIRLMDEFPNIKLLVMGHLDVPEELKKYRDRIIKKPFGDWRKLPKIIASLDINLAPIEESIFNEAKSENKWTEASLCGVVTVASDFGAFRDVIDDGKTGMLCETTEDWYEKIKKLVLNKKLRDEIGQNAKEKVLKDYVTTYTGLGLARFIESKLKKNIGFVLPTTNISGGVNVVLKHCDILRRNGWDVMVINMDVSDKNIVNCDGEVNVVSAVGHEFQARFDSLVATLYTTLDFVKRYPEVKNRFYFVQNFETDFNNFGSNQRRIANATYNATDDIKYITISKWCQRWLKDDFGKKAKYAPNGIDDTKFELKNRKFGKKVKLLIEGNSDDHYKNVDESFRIVEKLDKNKFEICYLSYQGQPKSWYRIDKFYHRVPHDKVGEIYGEADILLKSSKLESFSYPPLEMMATGGYVVVSPNAGNIEYLEDGKNCLFYEPGNIDEAVAKINQIVSDSKLRKVLKDGADKTVKERYWRDMEDKILDLYK